MRRPAAIVKVWRQPITVVAPLRRRRWWVDCTCGYVNLVDSWADAMADAERHIKARHTDDATADVIG